MNNLKNIEAKDFIDLFLDAESNEVLMENKEVFVRAENKVFFNF